MNCSQVHLPLLLTERRTVNLRYPSKKGLLIKGMVKSESPGQDSNTLDAISTQLKRDLWIDSIIYALLTKCKVKMAGYWPSYFFAFLLTET